MGLNSLNSRAFLNKKGLGNGLGALQFSWGSCIIEMSGGFPTSTLETCHEIWFALELSVGPVDGFRARGLSKQNFWISRVQPRHLGDLRDARPQPAFGHRRVAGPGDWRIGSFDHPHVRARIGLRSPVALFVRRGRRPEHWPHHWLL